MKKINPNNYAIDDIRSSDSILNDWYTKTTIEYKRKVYHLFYDNYSGHYFILLGMMSNMFLFFTLNTVSKPVIVRVYETELVNFCESDNQEFFENYINSLKSLNQNFFRFSFTYSYTEFIDELGHDPKSFLNLSF